MPDTPGADGRAEQQPQTAPSELSGADLSMAALYRHLPADVRAGYDAALQEVLHTLDRMPRVEQDAALRKVKREPSL